MLLLFCTGIVLLSACSGSRNQRISSQQTQMDNLRREVKFLKQQNSQFKRELANLTREIGEFAVANQQDRADLVARFDELMQQMEIVQSQLQDTNSRMTRFDRKARPVPRAFTPGNTAPPADSSATARTGTQSFTVDNARELYNTAYRDLIRGNYQLSLSGFQQFVQQYQNSELVDNAQYWIGEVYYAQGRYQQAIAEFEKVIKWYKDGDKTASALLKIAYSYININETEQGKIYLEEVLSEHPDSEEANLARGRLAALR